MPWHGNHGWDSHLTGLETRHRNGNLTDAGYAKALWRFAQRYEERAAAYSPVFRMERERAMRTAQRLRARASNLDGGEHAAPAP